MDLVVADGGFAQARARFDQEHVMLPLIVSEVTMWMGLHDPILAESHWLPDFRQADS